MRKFMAAICVTFLMVLQCAFFQVAVADDQYTAGTSDDLLSAQDTSINAGQAMIDWKASMPSKGEVHALALYIKCGDETFDTNDTASAFQSILGPRVGANGSATYSPVSGNAPYDSVADYYKRSSYGANGQVQIKADVVEVTLPQSHERYGNSQNVILAALAQLADASFDFSKYDGNGDKIVDCVYAHITGTQAVPAGDKSWWSSTGSPGTAVAYGGYEIQTLVNLHQPSATGQQSDTALAAATAIHETGHAMGLPDYYSTEVPQHITDSGQMVGIGTFDMMFNSAGDHNGFSKWLLGWLSDSKITYVVANADGITVKRNGVVTQKVTPTDGSSTVDVDLQSFVKEGEIAVVSTGDITSPYASYFILEYDRKQGNNDAIQIGNLLLPNGLRVFRVQAGLNSSGKAVRSNTNAASGERLIELIDPDGSKKHKEDSTNHSFYAEGATAYGCMLFVGGKLGSEAPSNSSLQGASVEPTTPGTTLDGKGTGIGIEVKSITNDQCTVTISTQGSSDPEPEPEPTPATVTHKVIFKANGHGTSPTTQIVEHGKTATKPADLTADGYTFGGWYKDEACTQKYDFSTPVTADTTLYAKWTQNGSAAGGDEASGGTSKNNQSSTKAASSTTSKNQTSSKAGTASSKTGDSPLVIGVVALVIVSGAAVVMAARRSRER